MSWLNTTVLVFHVLLAVGLVCLVLLQRGKGADAGAGFGAGASGTVFGARGSASFLSRTTAVLALLFFVSSLTLAYLGGRHAAPTSVVDRIQPLEPASSTGSGGNGAPGDTAMPALPAAKDGKPADIPSVSVEPPTSATKDSTAGPATSPTPAPAKN